MRVIALSALLAAGLAGSIILFFDGAYEIAAYEALLVVVAGSALRRLHSRQAREDEAPRRARIERVARQGGFRPPQLERIERLVEFGRTTAFDAEWRLIPFLRRIAAERIEVRYGIDWDGHPEVAAGLLGTGGWDVLRPDRELSSDRLGPGIDLVDLEVAVSAVENL